MISDLGYALSAAGYLLLLLLLFTVRKAGLAKFLLVTATAATALWALVQITSLTGPLTVGRILLADSVKQFAWLLFLAACIKDNFESIRQLLGRPATWFIVALPLVSIAAPFFVYVPETWRYLLLTVIALEILVLLEVVYRQSGELTWAFKPLILFLGVTNLFEFVMYANSTMVTKMEPTYVAARGFIYVAMLPFLVVAIRRIKHWGVDIFISREVVLHSSLLVVAGAYLFVMAIAGYAIKFIGGNWGATIQLVLFAMSLALLVTLFLSNSFRTKIKVFITKHFFANQFDYRIEWVKLTQTLETKPEEGLDKVYQTALEGLLQAIDYDSGRILKITPNGLKELAVLNSQPLSSEENHFLTIFTEYCEDKDWVIDLEEMKVKPFVYEDLKVDIEKVGQCRFQFVIPIYHQDSLWGVVLAQSVMTESRRLNWEFRDYLSAITAQVFSYVFHYEAAHEVAENAQFAAFSRMSAFVVHDLKNVLAQIDLILCNAEQHKHNPEFIEDTFETLTHTKTRMEKMLRQLTDKKAQDESLGSRAVTASEVIEEIISKRCAGILPIPQVYVETEKQLMLDEDKFGNVIYHLVSNAQQATADDGQVTVTLTTDASTDSQLIRIEDSGSGMTESFIRERLFKPFDTTKGNAGMGIGAYDAKNYMEKIGGSLSVKSEVDVGSTFMLSFPLSTQTSGL